MLSGNYMIPSLMMSPHNLYAPTVSELQRPSTECGIVQRGCGNAPYCSHRCSIGALLAAAVTVGITVRSRTPAVCLRDMYRNGLRFSSSRTFPLIDGLKS